MWWVLEIFPFQFINILQSLFCYMRSFFFVVENDTFISVSQNRPFLMNSRIEIVLFGRITSLTLMFRRLEEVQSELFFCNPTTWTAIHSLDANRFSHGFCTFRHLFQARLTSDVIIFFITCDTSAKMYWAWKTQPSLFK